MVDVVAARAAETLAVTRRAVNRSAGGTGLRTVSRGNFDQPTASQRELVAQELYQVTPAGVSDATCERMVLQHVGGPQTLDDDRVVALGVDGGERVQDVSNDGLDAPWGVGKLDLANDRDEPLVTIAPDRAAFRRSFEGSMDHRPQVAELGKAQRISHQAPELGMRLGFLLVLTHGISAHGAI